MLYACGLRRGGISSLDEIEELFYLGIEKVIINSASNQAGLIESATDRYGSQSIVGAIDIYKEANEKAFIYEHLDKRVTDRDPIDIALSLYRFIASRAWCWGDFC